LNLALSYEPEQSEARLLKGQVLIVRKDFAGAKGELQRYRRQQPQDTEAGRLVDRLVELCGRQRPDEEGTLLDFAHVFERQKVPALADGLLTKYGTSLKAKEKLLELYRKRIDDQWPGLGSRLSLDGGGIFRLDCLQRSAEVTHLDALKGMPLT